MALCVDDLSHRGVGELAGLYDNIFGDLLSDGFNPTDNTK